MNSTSIRIPAGSSSHPANTICQQLCSKIPFQLPELLALRCHEAQCNGTLTSASGATLGDYKALREECMDTKVNYAVVHELVKLQHKDIQDSNIRKIVLDLTNPAVTKLIVGATSIYGKKNNSAHYGTFAQRTASLFPETFSAYTQAKKSEKSFLELTVGAMEELYNEAKEAHASSGGYILFADYETTQGRFLMTAMLKKRDGLRLNDDLVPEILIELDLNSLYHAARINFTKYAEYMVSNAEERIELNYLSFLSQSSGRAAAGYFVTALGCAVGTASAAATENLIKESTKFFRDRPDLSHNRLAVKSDILRYLEDKMESGHSVKLSEIEALVRPYFPAVYEGQADDLADEFVAHLNSEAVGVPVEFPLSKRTLEKFTHVVYKTDNWQLKFDRGALGEGEDAEIRFMEKEGRLVINSLSQAAINLLRQAINDKADISGAD